MNELSSRDIVDPFVRAAEAGDLGAIDQLLADDVIEDYPQPGERMWGKMNRRAVYENCPGSVPSKNAFGIDRVEDGEDRWLITPSQSVMRIIGTGDQYTITGGSPIRTARFGRASRSSNSGTQRSRRSPATSPNLSNHRLGGRAGSNRSRAGPSAMRLHSALFGSAVRVLVGSLVLLSAGCGKAPPPSAEPAATKDIDPGGRLGPGMVFDYGSLWIALGDKGTVARVDPATGKITNELSVSDPARVPARAHVDHATPSAVISAFGSIWATGADGTLARVDPATNQVSKFEIGVVGGYLAAGEGAVWITSYDDGALVRFDPAGAVIRTTTELGGLHGVAVGFGSVWAVNKSGHEVLRLDPKSAAITARIPAARNPDFVTIGAGSVWVTRESPRGVVRIDPSANAVTSTIPAEPSWGSGGGIGFYDGAIWTGFLVRIDPATDKVSASFTGAGGYEQLGLAFGAGSVWVADFAQLHQIPLSLVR